MQISRQLLLACAVATCLTPSLLHAYDNEAQIRARQALEEKMKQMEAQPPQTNSAPPVVVKKPAKPAPVAPPQPPAPPAPPVVKVTPPEPVHETPPVVSAPAFAPEISQPATPTVPAVPATPAVPAVPAAPAVTVAPSEPAPVNWAATPSTDTATSDKLREALHEKMSQTPETAVQPPPPPAKPKKVVPAPVMKEDNKVVAVKPAPMPPPPPAPAPAPTAVYAPLPMTTAPGSMPTATPTPTPTLPPTMPPAGLAPMAGPASSLPAAKQQKLDELLQLYRADQLTPQQYHEQRAKILAAP